MKPKTWWLIAGILGALAGLVVAADSPAPDKSAGEQTNPPAKEAAKLTLEDLAGTWKGKTQFMEMEVEIHVDKEGNVLGGAMGTHPLQRKGKVALVPLGKQETVQTVRFEFYFADVCQQHRKTIEKVNLTLNQEGRHKLEGSFLNPCFPPSNGWIKLERVPRADEQKQADQSSAVKQSAKPTSQSSSATETEWVVGTIVQGALPRLVIREGHLKQRKGELPFSVLLNADNQQSKQLEEYARSGAVVKLIGSFKDGLFTVKTIQPAPTEAP